MLNTKKALKMVVITSIFYFCFFAMPLSMQDPSSPTRDQTHAPCFGCSKSQPLDHQGGSQRHILKSVVHCFWITFTSPLLSLLT